MVASPAARAASHRNSHDGQRLVQYLPNMYIHTLLDDPCNGKAGSVYSRDRDGEWVTPTFARPCRNLRVYMNAGFPASGAAAAH